MGNQKPENARPDGLKPGDRARPDTPEAGENICRECQGTGRFAGRQCPICGGTGIVIEKVGGE